MGEPLPEPRAATVHGLIIRDGVDDGEASAATIEPRASLSFVLDGRLAESIDGQSVDVAASGALYRPRGSCVERMPESRCARVLTVEFERTRELEFAGLFRGLQRHRQVNQNAFGELPRRLALELARHDAASPFKLEGLVLQIIAEAARLPCMQPYGPPPWLQDAMRIMRERFAHIGVADVAAAVGIDPIHLAREFRRYYGCTPGECLRRLRIDRASTLLAEGEMPLADIAAESGFYDQSHLSRVFKSIVGVTPAGYRAVHRNATMP